MAGRIKVGDYSQLCHLSISKHYQNASSPAREWFSATPISEAWHQPLDKEVRPFQKGRRLAEVFTRCFCRI